MTLLEDSTSSSDPFVHLSDEEVLSHSLDSPKMFSVLVARYQEPLLRRARDIVRNQEEAEDIVQEVFTKVYFNARRFTPQEGATLRSWIYKILMNTTFSHYQRLKKKGERREEVDPEIFESFKDPRNFSEEETMRDYVASFLSRMPQQLARPLKLHFLDEYSQKEIADMEGTSVSAIKTRIYRAKKEFEKLKEEQDRSTQI